MLKKISDRINKLTQKQILFIAGTVLILLSIAALIHAETVRYRMYHAETITVGRGLRAEEYYTAEVEEILVKRAQGDSAADTSNSGEEDVHPEFDSMNIDTLGYVYLVRVSDRWYYLYGTTKQLSDLKNGLVTMKDRPVPILVQAENQSIVESYAKTHFEKSPLYPGAGSIESGLLLHAISDRAAENSSVRYGFFSFVLGLFLLALGVLWGFWERKREDPEEDAPEERHERIEDLFQERRLNRLDYRPDLDRVHILEIMIAEEEGRAAGLKKQLEGYRERIRATVFAMLALSLAFYLLVQIPLGSTRFLALLLAFALLVFIAFLVDTAVRYWMDSDSAAVIRFCERKGIRNISMELLERQTLITRLKAKVENIDPRNAAPSEEEEEVLLLERKSEEFVN